MKTASAEVQMKTKEQANLSLAYELKDLASKWFNQEFNCIQLNVFETMAKEQGSELFEFIKAPEVKVEEFISNYGCRDLLIEFQEQESDTLYIKDLKKMKKLNEELYSLEHFTIDEDKFFQFVIDNHQSWDRYKDEQQSENYPMWNTIFEFKEEPTERIIEAAEEAGCGIIEGMDDFNTSLFVSGCGYSFYGAHWIPLFLAMPYNERLREKYKGVDYSMM